MDYKRIRCAISKIFLNCMTMRDNQLVGFGRVSQIRPQDS